MLPLLLHLNHPERCFFVMITPNVTSAIAMFGAIYNTYMLVLVVEVWLVFRPEIVERANSRSGVVGLFYRTLTLGVREITDGARAIDERMIRALNNLFPFEKRNQETGYSDNPALSQSSADKSGSLVTTSSSPVRIRTRQAGASYSLSGTVPCQLPSPLSCISVFSNQA